MAASNRPNYFVATCAFMSIISLRIWSINCQITNAVLTPANTDLNSICSCDLTFNKCDINCCCDNECTANDRQAFSQCDDYYGVDNSQKCIKRKMIFINNSPYIESTVASDLFFCVYTDNYLQRNNYFQPETVNTSFQFGFYMSRHVGFWNSNGYPFRPNVSEGATYRSGDVVLTKFDSNATGILGLPRSVNNGNCMDINPVGFLLDQSFTCTRQVAALATSCQTAPELNAATFYLDFSLFQQPGDFSANISNINYTVIEPVLPATCIDVNGFVTNCPSIGAVPVPEYNSVSAVCNYALSQLEYEMTYDPDRSGMIVRAEVSFRLRQINNSSLPLVQTYKVRWRQLNTNYSNAVFRSGNPGYLVGYPVLAGSRIQQVIDGVTRVAVSMNSDPNNRLTMMASSVSGDCEENRGSRVPINFGVNMRSGCTIKKVYNAGRKSGVLYSVFFGIFIGLISLENMTNSCGLIQDLAKNLLLGADPPGYVGRYGNTEPGQFGDWVPILTENEPPVAQGSSSQPGVCFNMVLGMHYQILYAKTGFLSNPQNKVIGVMRRYQPPQVLRFNCMGEYCQPETSAAVQKVEIISSVSFIDVSEPALPFEKSRPLLAIRLPYDFFYPFVSGKATNIATSIFAILLSAILTVAMVLN